MKLKFPPKSYIKDIVVNEDNLQVNFARRKKIALVFICINERYWPYIRDVINDCQKLFLPQHEVEYFLWTDIPELNSAEYRDRVSRLLPKKEFDQFRATYEMYPPNQFWPMEIIRDCVREIRNNPKVKIIPTDPIEWPAPTLMRYHLFLNEEGRLRGYDYVFYMDADMRVVDRISDEILGDGLTAAPHPGYELDKRFLPPYEPNRESAAYIPRLGRLVQEGGSTRFHPFYAAGGFQGGTSKEFIKAMRKMRASIDADYVKNYTAIWNDESHWNKYLWAFQQNGGKITFLDPSYVYPDSLIKEYYEPIWGRSYPPKIITLTKPFSLSKQAGAELGKMLGMKTEEFVCPHCRTPVVAPGHRIKSIQKCNGAEKPHLAEMEKI